MNREQQEVLSLLKEIDKICQKHRITYYLSPQLTLCAVTGQPFPKNPMAGMVLMKVADMERFRQVFEEDPPMKRALEYMGNNKRFPGFFLRYANTDTLCYRLDEGRNFQVPGLGINIVPLRGKIRSRRGHIWNRAQEVGWQEICDKYADRPDKEKFFSGLLVRFLCLGGRARLGRRLYKKFCKRQQGADTAEYVVRRKKDTLYYKPEVFESPVRVELEGERFWAPGDIEVYLTRVYGAEYEKRLVEKYTPSPSQMVSAYIPCQVFLDEIGSQGCLIRSRRRMYKRQLFGRKLKNYANDCWAYAKFCASERELSNFYLNKKDYIKNLYNNEDYLSLENVFKPYTKMMQKALNKKELYVADEELMEIYLDILAKTGKTVLKGKIEKYWR